MRPTAVLLHYHLPKTGGQTVRDCLLSRLDPGEDVLHLARIDSNALTRPGSNSEIAHLSDAARDQIRAVTGHTVDFRTAELFAGRRQWTFVVLRDPASRLVSHYNFDCARADAEHHARPEFTTWYESRRRNEMTRFLLNRLGTKPSSLAGRLSSLDFVGCTRQMDDWFPELLRILRLDGSSFGRKNVTGVDHERVLLLDEQLRQRIERDNADDVELFRFATSRLFDGHLRRLTRAEPLRGW